jgi:hypothetical protein
VQTAQQLLLLLVLSFWQLLCLRPIRAATNIFQANWSGMAKARFLRAFCLFMP